MAEKRYKLTAAVVAAPQYSDMGNQYEFKTSFATQPVGGEVMICQVRDCPLITCTSADVLGTTNEWAQRFMEAAKIPPAPFKVNGTDYLGTPGAAIFEITTDPVTIDLDAIFPS